MEFGQRTLESLEVTPAFWAGKRVMITGHTGFKGSWLSLLLQDLGSIVQGYSLAPSTRPNHYELVRVSDGMKSELGDVRDFASLRESVEKFHPQIVFHLAAQSLVRPSYDDPRETYSTNVMGTVNVLEAIRQCVGIRVALIVTSDKCYENKERDRGYTEDEPMGGFDPYSSSKGCAELVTASFRNAFFNPHDYHSHGTSIATVRAGNVIGGGDWAKDRLIPDIIKAFMEGRDAQIRNPDAIRPWQHVLDSLSGYIILAQRAWEQGPAFAEPWNFGADEEQSRPVHWIAEHLASLWSQDSRWIAAGESATKHEAHYLKLDCSKAKSRLGWRPRLNLRDALEWTVEWYRAYSGREDMRGATLAQIHRYRDLEQA